ncbi:protein ABSCISIC ACID-INSENSITIVE 5-like isoform X2 [Olea europaea var. sylvestris]|uniref:BZIP domain-containing protein n=1 Tax=Olea europaea subsp. europaea TaxID=158383 RepID=A0A8S0SJ33_OLEEU|nr:protein ABSCISIC ACID-INSENSITIVE 5-like isoform X2 [Olea europaea var. sylvestris]CAA2992636.1 Hypothetical predicted protein [Olea europaea subsp. europaea]
MMSLEEFLAKAGAVEENFLEVGEERELERIYVYDNSPVFGKGMAVGVDFGVPSPVMGMGVSVGVDAGRSLPVEGMGVGVGVDVEGHSPVVGMGEPLPVVDVGGSRNGKGREKNGLSSLGPVDRTDRRAIKKREVAARARARMQARILGLELRKKSLEEENDQLTKEKLMEKVIPVVERRRSPCVLRRVHSMEW